MSESFARLTAALADRYALQREAGAGGMATVYLAEDVKHHRKVAVKVLRPELAATLGPTRFLREIEIAAQLQHPHILPLLDSGESDGFLYYVMPFIEGESLRDRLLKQGELPVPEAIRILRDVADALSYAHARGVVHRDIKPDNVMLAGRHALVTDFGVAKAVSEAHGQQGLTTAGVALGTPAYMAPEQAAADPHIDHRADLYALGAMGYELLAGRPPFTGTSPQQVLAAHLTQTPEPVSAQRPACPPALNDVIMRCLAKRPSDRWQSADDVVHQLETLGTPSGGSTPAATAPFRGVSAAAPAIDPWYGHPFRVGGFYLVTAVAMLGVAYFLTIQLGLPDWVLRGAMVLLGLGLPIMLATGLIERRRAVLKSTGMFSASSETPLRGAFTFRRAVVGGLLAFGVLAAGAVIYTAMRLLGVGPVGTLVASGRLSAKDKLLVADFVNKSADTTLGGSVSEAFRIDLAQSPVVSVLGSSAVSAALVRMNHDPAKPLDAVTARELATREGVKAIVVGEISPVGKGFVLSARVLSAADGSELVVQRETADDDTGILKAIDRLSKSVRERIGESLRTIRANEPLEQVTTSSLEALRLYTEGVQATAAAENERAIALLQQAVAIDSGFAMAWRKLSVALSNSGGSLAAANDAATKAYAHRDRLPELERYQTVGFYFWRVANDPDKAIAAYRAVLGISPEDPAALVNLTGILNGRRQWADAETLGIKGITAVPQTAAAYNVTIQAQLAQGRFKEARATLDRMASNLPESPAVPYQRGGYFVAIGAYDSARATIQAAALKFHDLSDRQGFASGLGALDQLEGKLRSAAQHYAEAAALAEQRQLPGQAIDATLGVAGIQVVFQHDPAAALKTVETALQRHPLNAIPAWDRPYIGLAIAYAVAGQPQTAKRYLSEFDATVPEAVRKNLSADQWAQGYIALAEGRGKDAVSSFHRARDMGSCTNCAFFELGQAFDMLKQPDSALAAYSMAVDLPHDGFDINDQAYNDARSFRRLGELYEEKGNRDKALDYYGRFVRLWKDADSGLQPQVKDVRDRMARLTAEGRR